MWLELSGDGAAPSVSPHALVAAIAIWCVLLHVSPHLTDVVLESVRIAVLYVIARG